MFQLATDRHQAGLAAGTGAYALWGLLTVYWHELDGFDAFELIGWRIIMSAVVMGVVLTVTGRWSFLASVIHDRRLLGRVVGAALLLTVNWTAYVYAVVHGRVIETSLGYFIAPVGTMLVGVYVLGERMRRTQWITIALATVAIVVLTASYGRVPYLALMIAGSWTVYGYLKKQVKMTPIDGMAAEVFVLLVPAVVVVIALAGRTGSIPSTASTTQITLLAFSGLVTIVPLTMFAFSAHRVPLNILGPLQYLVPTINFLLGWLVYGEDLPAARLAGFALVWVGLAILTADSLRRSGLLLGPAIPPDPLAAMSEAHS